MVGSEGGVTFRLSEKVGKVAKGMSDGEASAGWTKGDGSGCEERVNVLIRLA